MSALNQTNPTYADDPNYAAFLLILWHSTNVMYGK